MAAAASETIALPVARRLAERKIEALQLQLETDCLRREYAQRLLQQLLPGFVAFEYR